MSERPMSHAPKKTRWTAALLLCGIVTSSLALVTGDPAERNTEAATTQGEPGTDADSATSTAQAERESRFREMLTGATLRGHWQRTGDGGLRGGSPLTDPKPEEYAIQSVRKIGAETWLIGARIRVMDKDVTIPVPVRVLWAGDTPIITLDDLPVPVLGTYSARVMIYRGFYSGTWLSNQKDYGGVMAGQIVKTASIQEPKAQPKPVESLLQPSRAR